MKLLPAYCATCLLIFCGSVSSCGQMLPEAKVTLRVLDENGHPVEGASAGVGFDVLSGRSFESKTEGRSGLTGADGTFTTSNPTVGYIQYNARKAGYYDSYYPMYQFTKKELGHWLPYNISFDVVLKKTINPVPMYAKTINVAIPDYEVPLGYDLSFGDWAIPYGKGTTSDITFFASMNKRSEEDYDYRLTVSFSNKGDGIQIFEAPYQSGSILKSPQQAPADGYLPTWVQVSKQRPNLPRETNRDNEKHNYFFRIRTVVDEQGRVVKACYGKIYGDFMNFTYYLNPDNTRNMEYDTRRDLIPKLNSFEQPSAP